MREAMQEMDTRISSGVRRVLNKIWMVDEDLHCSAERSIQKHH